MPLTPNFSFYRKPRFSVNQFTDYLSTVHAGQRERIIRDAKFPKKVLFSHYREEKRAMQDFLADAGKRPDYFDDLIGRLTAKARREEENRDAALRGVKAINSFKELYDSKRWSKISFGPGPENLSLKVAGVSISTRLDSLITEQAKDGAMHSGGIVLFMSSTADARKNIEQRRKQVAWLINWALEGSGNIEPLPRLCMSMDVFGGELTKASSSQSTFRANVASAAREAFTTWPSVEPPSGYDGPNWQ